MKDRIINTPKKSITDKLFKLYLVSIASPALFVTGLYFIQQTTEKIKDKDHLENILNQEKKKLGIENKFINVDFNDKIETSRAIKISDIHYLIELSNNQKNLGVLRHELCHIANGDCDTDSNGLYSEIKAKIYGATKIRL